MIEVKNWDLYEHFHPSNIPDGYYKSKTDNRLFIHVKDKISYRVGEHEFYKNIGYLNNLENHIQENNLFNSDGRNNTCVGYVLPVSTPDRINLNIIDDGEGQHPEEFINTTLKTRYGVPTLDELIDRHIPLSSVNTTSPLLPC